MELTEFISVDFNFVVKGLSEVISVDHNYLTATLIATQ